MPTAEDNAPQPTAEDNAIDVTTLSLDQLESNPYVKELKEKHAAARTQMDKSNLTKKQLEAELAKYKTLVGEEDAPEAQEDQKTPDFVTKEELSNTLWETQNAQDLELYADDEYQKELDRGVPRDIALHYAKLRQQKDQNSAKLLRQQSMASSGASSVRDLENIEITEQDRADMAKWGYSEATLLKQKKLKAMRGQ